MPKWSHLHQANLPKDHEIYKSRVSLLTKYVNLTEIIKSLGIILLYDEFCNNKHFISQSERAKPQLNVSITVIKMNEGNKTESGVS